MLAQHSLHLVGLHWPAVSLAHPEAWAYALLTRVHRGWCAMRGHEFLLHFAPRRVSLTCADCGWESPGWTLEPRKSGVPVTLQAPGAWPPRRRNH